MKLLSYLLVFGNFLFIFGTIYFFYLDKEFWQKKYTWSEFGDKEQFKRLFSIFFTVWCFSLILGFLSIVYTHLNQYFNLFLILSFFSIAPAFGIGFVNGNSNHRLHVFFCIMGSILAAIGMSLFNFLFFQKQPLIPISILVALFVISVVLVARFKKYGNLNFYYELLIFGTIICWNFLVFFNL